MSELRYCKKCDSKKPLTEEFWHHRKSRKDGWEFYCSECVRKTTLINYNKNKSKWNETTRKNKRLTRDKINKYKDSCCCLKCGEKRNYVLDFHHLDPKIKDFQIAQGSAKGWKKILLEIDKCIILCSNCHREFHYLEKQNNISIEEYLKKL